MRVPVLPVSPFTTCPLLALTGLNCPFCGGTRATFALLRGDVGAALDLNALWVLSIPLLAWFVLARLLPAVRQRRWPSFAISAVAARRVGLVLVAFAVIRNLPVDPFALLKA